VINAEKVDACYTDLGVRLATMYLFTRYGGRSATKDNHAELFGKFGVDLDFTYLHQEMWFSEL